MNDNRVSISTELDNSGIEKGAGEIKGELGGVEGAVNDLRDALDAAFSGDFDKSIMLDGSIAKEFEAIRDQMETVGVTAEKTGEQIKLTFSKMDVSKPIAAAADQVRALEEKLVSVSKEAASALKYGTEEEAAQLGSQRAKVYDQLEAARLKLFREIVAAAQKEEATERNAAKRAADAKIKEEKRATLAKQKETEKQQKAALKPVKRFGNRLQSIVSGALVFNLLSAGLRTMTQYFGNALKSNQQFTASFAKLKGALMTAFQPIYEAALPALLALMRVLTAAIHVIGQFFAKIFGKSTSQMAENAEALNKEANAIEGVGGAAKEAKKHLAGFDEINKLNADNAGGGGGGISSIAPDFDMSAELSDTEEKLGNILAIIGSIGAAIAAFKIASFFGASGLVGFIIAAVVGLVTLIAIKGEEIKAILQDVDVWLQDVFARDWRETFGPVLGSVINGFMEAVESIWGGISRMLNGVIDFIRGVFTGDWERALSGIVDICGGAIDVLMGLMYVPFEWIGTALFDLAQKMLPESWKNGINAVIAVINKFISWLNNTLAFYVPPIEIAGETIFSGGHIQLVNLSKIPMLAQGAVIPANAPFLAMLGDQRHGTNIEAPLSTIQEAVALVMEDQMSTMMAGFEALLAENRLLREVVEGIEIGDDVLGKAVNRYNVRLATMRGDG